MVSTLYTCPINFKYEELTKPFFFRLNLFFSTEFMTCFSRLDTNKELFTRKITKGYNPKKQRRNYNLLVDVKNGTVFCQNRNYTTYELCYLGNHPDIPDGPVDPQKCVLKTGEEIGLNGYM